MCTAKQDLVAAISMMNIHVAKLKSAMDDGKYFEAATAISALANEAKHATGLIAKVTVAQRNGVKHD
mgnify:CR=1 FL=1